MKYQKTAVAALMALGLFMTGCGGDSDSGGVAYMNHNDEDVFGQTIKSSFDQAAKSSGLKVTYYDAKGDGNFQADQFKEVVEGGAKEIVLLAVNGELMAPLVDDAIDKGVTIVAMNRDVATDKAIAVRSNEIEAGIMQADYMVKNLPQGAKVAYLAGTMNQMSSRARWEGFKTHCLDKRPDVELLSMQDGSYSRAEALKITTMWLSLFPKIDAIVCGNDEMALGAIAALKAANRLEGCMVSGVDATDAALKAIAVGEMVQTVKQDAVGQAKGAITVIEEIGKGNPPPKDIIIPFASITKDNLNEFVGK